MQNPYSAARTAVIDALMIVQQYGHVYGMEILIEQMEQQIETLEGLMTPEQEPYFVEDLYLGPLGTERSI